jgi:hypothetical protein
MMTPDLEDALRKDFAPMYANLTWGFACEDGWEPIIRKLSKNIAGITNTVEVDCVKSKWAGLRFYFEIDRTSLSESEYKRIYEAIDKLVESACDLAEETCERCGKKAVGVSDGGWVQTLCAVHLGKQTDAVS